MKNLWKILLSVIFLTILFTILIVINDEVKSEKIDSIDEIKNNQTMITANTTRIGSDNPIETAVSISQYIYPVTEEENSPGAIILVDKNSLAEILVAARVQHFPVNAPLLYVDGDKLPDLTKSELKRLKPEGVAMDKNIQVYFVGNIPKVIQDEVKEMGFRIKAFESKDPLILAEEVDDWASTIHGDHDNVVIIANEDDPETAIPAAYWNAHMGNGFAFVTNEGIPDATKRILQRRLNGPWIYVFGSSDVIADDIVEELSSYGHVTRIKGNDLSSISSYFAGFKDIGKDWGAWVIQKARDFGWGISEAGHNVIFVNPDGPSGWQNAIPATTLSHMGKHAPVLIIGTDNIPDPVDKFLKVIKPFPLLPRQQIVNHGLIIGGIDTISWQNQVDIDKLLKVRETGKE